MTLHCNEWWGYVILPNLFCAMGVVCVLLENALLAIKRRGALECHHSRLTPRLMLGRVTRDLYKHVKSIVSREIREYHEIG